MYFTWYIIEMAGTHFSVSFSTVLLENLHGTSHQPVVTVL